MIYLNNLAHIQHILIVKEFIRVNYCAWLVYRAADMTPCFRYMGTS